MNTDARKVADPGTLLGDTAARDYSEKLQRFNAFAAPELQEAVASLQLQRGMAVLDVGCGTGEALEWLDRAVGPEGTTSGIDLSEGHVRRAALRNPRSNVVQGDILKAPFPRQSFDLIWCVNTLNHFSDPVSALRVLQSLLKPAARIAVGQSSFLPDMVFAWDSRLERVVTWAVREYYFARYGISESDVRGSRGLVGVMRQAGLSNITVKTRVIERVSPIAAADEEYLRGVLLRDMFGSKLRPHLSKHDYEELSSMCDPESSSYALRRPDFHFLQTFSLVVGHNGPT